MKHRFCGLLWPGNVDDPTRHSIQPQSFHSSASQTRKNSGPLKALSGQKNTKQDANLRPTHKSPDQQDPQNATVKESQQHQGHVGSASLTSNEHILSEPSPAAKAQQSHAEEPPPSQPQTHESEAPQRYILPYNFQYYSRSFRQLAMSLPQLHRPTQEDFLRVADGFWQRLRIRFKWFTIKSFRKFNADDISGIVTWILMSQTIWILVGTTTFLSVVFAIANSLRLQHFVARGISDYLTSETGITIIFESAIVPKWKDSRISFKNVYVSRRPLTTLQRKTIDAHMAAAGIDVGNQTEYQDLGEDEEDVHVGLEEDTNYSIFDLNIDSVDVTLSLWRWLDGRGLVEDAVVKGVRGVLDRRSVIYDPDHPLDPASFRHESHPGDFELDSLQLEDVLITVYQPGGFRPYTASIFRAEFRTFRKKWMFYDFLSAENIVGQFDNCLFSLHKPQSIGRTMGSELQDGDWARMSRIRIDGVNIDHLQASTSMEGPVSWITSGKLDAVLDIKFPKDPDDALALNVILEEIAEAISTTLSTSPALDPLRQRIPGQRELAKPPLSAPETDDAASANLEHSKEFKVVIELDLRFRDVKAAVPIFANDLSYVNNALIRPIVAFMNANRTLVPIHCRVVKNLNDFDGAWTMWETGLLDEISFKIYDALAFHVTQANFNRRVKTVSVWSLHMTASAVLSAFRNLVDPVSIRIREAYLRSQEERERELFNVEL
ncbi:mitochondrial distribution and morphology proteins-domain-containing protein [Lentinula boryana]|uniref:Mitochondrial distribution and morphology proteins-domain-containing protein n=1 Tax=Lentinula boryana TaxID=40481 RepID=A0ABQ8Q9B9_9AGAR|nr:mitochondrial distribution and morphology proteins-domain-containing protein [Lentinula boryana]